ncbi:hypothetical protein D9758_003372 [Tetrapyrgos nigripes]|uniref:Uncharacterized protein n=1 Tax=Tetrapyrgos nigripes TaxID=182062 RepID=A0A8H5GV70_9AGAR|nr:hypothetical protein D9758_003372 [Tetrapyrgos nigripes]
MASQNASSASSSQQQSLPLSNSDVYIILSWMPSVAIRSLLYGMYITLSMIAIYLFLQKGISFQHSRGSDSSASAKARLALFILTIIMMVFSTISLVLSTEFYITQLPLFSFHSPNLPKIMKLLVNEQIVLLFMERMNYLISDGIVVWRAWIMFPDQRVVGLALTFLMLSSCAGVFVDAGLASTALLGNPSNVGSQTRGFIISLPTITTNAVATGLIAWKAWNHHQDLKKNLQNSSSLTRVQKVLLLLVESGTLYCLLWVAYITISARSGPSANSFQELSSAMPFISALYPIIIILIATVESKDRDDRGMSLSLSQSIRFASVQSPVLSTAGVEGETNSKHDSVDVVGVDV